MLGPDLPEEAVTLLPGLAASSPPRALSQLVTLVAGQVPGCSGATAALWRDGAPAVFAASHPDLSGLAELEHEAGPGPVHTALNENHPVHCPDLLAEDRWPEYATAALARGVRCTLTLVHRSGPSVVSLTMYGARPRALSDGDVPVARLLTAFGGAMLGSAAQHEHTQRTVLQLREAANSRALVDQATGVLMNSLGCTADEALARMRQISQRSGLKVTEVARKIVESPGFPGS
jgi:hypothetical protein